MMSASGIHAWFQLADSNQFIFRNALCNDVLLRTTSNDQRILIGPSPNDYATITVTSNTSTFQGEIHVANGGIVGDCNNMLYINQVTVSNGTLTASNLVATAGATITGGYLEASGLIVNDVMIVDSNGALVGTNIPENSIPGSKIVNNSIPGSKYGTGSIIATAYSNASITAPKFLPGAVDTTALSNSSITTSKYVPLSIDTAAIAYTAIKNFNIYPQGVDTIALSNQSVTADKIARNITLNGTTTSLGRIAINNPTPKLTSALDVTGAITMTSNGDSITVYSSKSNIGINTSNPEFTLDVNGNINFTGKMYWGGWGGTQYIPNQWWSPPALPGTGCNITYMDGYVGIGISNNISSRLHVGASVSINSNLIFNNPLNNTNTAVILSSSSSNLGLNQSTPQHTLDIGGSLGIKNTVIVDSQRNIKNINVASVTRLGVLNTNPVFDVDVIGNARFDATRMVTNSNNFLVTSKGLLPDTESTCYFKIMDLKAITDTTNYGAVVIEGDMGNRAYNTAGTIKLIVGTRDVPSPSYYQVIGNVLGAQPAALASSLDLVLYENANGTQSLYIKSVPNSYFNLSIHGGAVMANFYSDWRLTKITTTPTGTPRGSIIDSANIFVGLYNGEYTLGSVKCASLSNFGNTYSSNGLFYTPQSQFVFNSSLNVLGSAFIGDSNMAIASARSVSFGKSTATLNDAAIMSYTHQGNSSTSNIIDVGFTQNNIMSLTSDRRVGIGRRIPNQTLDVAGHANFDGMILSTASAESRKFFSIGGRFSNLTTAASKWMKLAKISPFLTLENKACITVQGVLADANDGMNFDLTMNLDASNSINCFVNLEYTTHTTNYFKTIFDIVAYVDANKVIHVYAKCAAVALVMNMDMTITQTSGLGIETYSTRSYTGIVFSDTTRPIAAVDTDVIQGAALFVVSTQSAGTKITMFDRTGRIGIGTENPSTLLTVQGTVTSDITSITSGQLITTAQSAQNFTVNGLPIVGSDGKFITSSISNDTITFNQLQRVAVSNILSLVTLSNIYPITTAVGIFNSNPTAELDLYGTLSIGLTDRVSKVLLTTSQSNGLGVNKPAPKFALDVGGDINFDGILYKNSAVFHTTQWTTSNTSIYFGSNVAIGPGVILPSEPLSVFDRMSLSNTTGKIIMYTSNSFLGVNLNTPTSTLDVGGTIGINNVPIFDGSRNMSNVQTISTPIFTVSPTNVGINKPNPTFSLDVIGDINLTGMMRQNGTQFYASQWKGSNLGITYSNVVSIGGADLPTYETLTVSSNMSLSNNVGKVLLELLRDASAMYVSTPIVTQSYTLSNNTGSINMYQYQSNLGINIQTPSNNKLEVGGSIGINGTRIIDTNYTISNVSSFYSKWLTAKDYKVGIGMQNPLDSLSVNGLIGVSNLGYTQMTAINNQWHMIAVGMNTSNQAILGNHTRTGLTIDMTSNVALPAFQISSQRAYGEVQSTAANKAAYIKFTDSNQNTASVGLDGDGMTSALNVNTYTIMTSNNNVGLDIRFVTKDLERMRVQSSSGNVGIGLTAPQFTLDVGGTGIGVAGRFFVDVDRSVDAKYMGVRSIQPSAMTMLKPYDMFLTLIYNTGGVRGTARSSQSFAAFSNLVFNNPGKVVTVCASNMYFSGTDGQSSTQYVNFAYQPLMPNRYLNGLLDNLNMDVYVLNNSNNLNIVGNAQIAATQWEMVNPSYANQDHTIFRLRNWDSADISNAASITNSNYLEMKLDNVLRNAKINTDRPLAITYNDSNMMLFTQSTVSSIITVTGTNQFRVTGLQGGGNKPVYADSLGSLTFSSSDSRMKENVLSMETTVDMVMKMRPVRFHWRSDYLDPATGNVVNLRETRGEQQELGLIAQEVQEHFPEVVGATPDGALYVDYAKIVPVLIKAIQELKQENEMIKAFIKM